MPTWWIPIETGPFAIFGARFWLRASDARERFWRRLTRHHGTAIVFGMTITTLIGIFLIPVCHVFVQGLAEWGRKKPANAATPSPELAALVVFRR